LGDAPQRLALQCVVPSSFSEYAAWHRAQREREQLALPALQARARQAAHDAAARIGTRVGARRVLLFGSLARGSFGLGSDIDLAVEGLAAGRLVDALAAAEDGCPFRVDVVPLESTRPEMTRRIASEGTALWPR
jgi:predicted nucleotidyltransferase